MALFLTAQDTQSLGMTFIFTLELIYQTDQYHNQKHGINHFGTGILLNEASKNTLIENKINTCQAFSWTALPITS
jgi:hypothetical protein